MELLNEMLPYIIGILTVLATYLGNKLRQWLDVKVAVDKQKQIEGMVKASVLWVEQVYGVDMVEVSQDKFEQAKQRSLFLLQNAGLEVDEEYLETLIEAFVFELLNKGE